MKRVGSGAPDVDAPSTKRACGTPAAESAEQAQTRSACRAMLTKAFVEGSIDLADATPLVAAIEQALYDKHNKQTSKEYKAAGRSLGQNLKRNPDLRKQLLEGELQATQLVHMSWQELSTEEQRQRDGKVQAKLMRLVTLHDASATAKQADGETYTCSKCQSTTCEVLDAGRRDIGKCETWGSKLSSDKERLVTCLSCGHKWEVSGLV